ncbi:MAG: hypothetical protein AB7S41_10095 [Parvibaculaceae bacterium]
MWGSLLAGLAATQATVVVKRAVRRTALLSIAGIIAVTGVGFLLAAAYIRLSMSYDSVTAGLSLGFFLLIVAGVVAYFARRPKAVPAAPLVSPSVNATGIPPSLAALSGSGALPLIAFALGLMVAKSGGKKR